MIGKMEVLSDAPQLAECVAEWMTEEALASTAPFRISLSGGSTPKTLYELLASDKFRNRFPWERVMWFWGDERFVPRNDPDSNYKMVNDAMFSKAPVPLNNIFPIPVDGDADAAASRYESTLHEIYGAAELEATRPFFDIVLLGLGPDGHTASLLPGEPVLKERRKWVASVPHGRQEIRITMTYPLIESARNVAFLVAGRDKAEILNKIRAGDHNTPAAQIQPIGELHWFVDREAASGFDSSPKTQAALF